MMIAFTGFEVTLGLFLDEHFHLKEIWLGVILSVFGVVMAIIQGKKLMRICQLEKICGGEKMNVNLFQIFYPETFFFNVNEFVAIFFSNIWKHFF